MKQTKKQLKRIKKQQIEAAEKFYSDFAKMNGFTLTNFTPIKGNVFGDGIPRCVCVHKNNGN